MQLKMVEWKIHLIFETCLIEKKLHINGDRINGSNL